MIVWLLGPLLMLGVFSSVRRATAADAVIAERERTRLHAHVKRELMGAAGSGLQSHQLDRVRRYRRNQLLEGQ